MVIAFINLVSNKHIKASASYSLVYLLQKCAGAKRVHFQGVASLAKTAGPTGPRVLYIQELEKMGRGMAKIFIYGALTIYAQVGSKIAPMKGYFQTPDIDYFFNPTLGPKMGGHQTFRS